MRNRGTGWRCVLPHASAAITSRLGHRCLLNMRLFDLKVGLEALGKKRISCSTRESNYDSAVVQTDRAIPSPCLCTGIVFTSFCCHLFVFVPVFVGYNTAAGFLLSSSTQCTKYYPLGPPLHDEKMQNYAS
jgi:hypothetical protein